MSERNFWYWVMYIQDMVQDEISTVYLCCCTKSLSILCMDPCPALVVSLCLSGISIYFIHFHDFCNKKFFVKLSLFSVFVLHKTRTCFSVWVQYNSDWNLCQKLWLCLNILLGWMWEWKHWVNEQMVFDMLLNDLPVSVELFTVINASSHPWMMVEFVWVWHMLSLCIVLSSKCVEQW